MKKENFESLGAVHTDSLTEKGKILIKYRNVIKQNKGITMVALVVTIIIMIILIGITINLTIGNNGLITKAKQAKKDIEEATLNEQAAMNELYDEMMIATGSTSDNISTDGIPDRIIEYIDAKLNAKMLEVYPVGSIYITTETTNPSELFGGTWESYGKGRTLVGVDEGQGSNQEGGSSTATLTVENLPSHYHRYTPSGTISSTFNNGVAESAGAHSHSFSAGGNALVVYASVNNHALPLADGFAHGTNNWFSNGNKNVAAISSSGAHTHTVTGTVSSTFSGTTSDTESTGSGTSFSVQNPYITVYMWKRIE